MFPAERAISLFKVHVVLDRFVVSRWSGSVHLIKLIIVFLLMSLSAWMEVGQILSDLGSNPTKKYFTVIDMLFFQRFQTDSS